MNMHRQRQQAIDTCVFAKEAQQDEQSKNLDEALEESFPASDPVAISITAIDPAGGRSKDRLSSAIGSQRKEIRLGLTEAPF
ncbi:hypothetical protein [Massilia sp.]|uniref:hypothetical protein n=1 Tax=Massilia sp. TaxID=1882437 RepID=UPI00352CFECB